MSDIVLLRWLRAPYDSGSMQPFEAALLVGHAREAANRIEKLTAERDKLMARVAELEAALAPFSDAADEADDWDGEDNDQAPVSCGQCREARATLASIKAAP